MSRLSTILLFTAAAVSALAAYWISQETQSTEAELRRLQRDILLEQEAIHVARADWSYLTRPARIFGKGPRRINNASRCYGGIIANGHPSCSMDNRSRTYMDSLTYANRSFGRTSHDSCVGVDTRSVPNLNRSRRHEKCSGLYSHSSAHAHECISIESRSKCETYPAYGKSSDQCF